MVAEDNGSQMVVKWLSKKKYHGDKPYTEYLSNSLTNLFRPCDNIEIELLKSELNINKCSGPDGIPINIFHLIKTIISEPSSKIFNTSILTGQYINKLNLTITIPIFKKGCWFLTIDPSHFYLI